MVDSNIYLGYLGQHIKTQTGLLLRRTSFAHVEISQCSNKTVTES